MKTLTFSLLMTLFWVINSFQLFAQPTPPAGYEWQLAKEDDFEGSSLDTAYWGFGSTPWGSENQSSCTWIAPEDSYLENGNLVLRSRLGPFTAPSGTEFDQTSGWVWIKPGNWQAYGYLEIRAQYPDHQGAWPAFWMLKDGWPPEIDVAEYRGSPKNYMTTAFYDGSWYTTTHPGDYTGWHTYALEWSPGELKFYMDGEVIKAHGGSSVPSDPMYVILSNGTSCSDGDGTGFPNYFNVDYFRWYQTAPDGSSTITIEENTTGFCSVDGSVANNHSGYTGSGFADTDNATGTGVDWKVDFATSGTKTFTVRYANGSSSNRPANLLIDGTTVVSDIDFKSTGDWGQWVTVSFEANVNAGASDIRLVATTGSGTGNIDNITISDASAVDCDGSGGSGITSGETYSITVRNSGRALYADGTTNNSPVKVYDYSGVSDQQWTVTSTSGGYYRLTNVASGRDLDAAGTSNNSPVQIYSYWGGDNQQWEINDLGTGYYSVTNRSSGKALDIGGTANDSPAQIYDYWGGQNQQFQFTTVGSGSRTAANQNDIERTNDLEQAAAKEILLYPNPVSDILNLTLPKEYGKSTEIEIYNAAGQITQRKYNIESISQRLDLSDLNQGIYFIKISSDTDVITRKFVKK